MTIPMIDQVVIIALPLVIGGAIGFFFNFVGGYSKEYFTKRERVGKHKLEVARHVLRSCHEANTSNFRVAPREMEDVNSTMTDLDGVDKKMGVKLNEMVSSWSMFSRERGRGGKTGDDVKFMKEHLDRAEGHRVALVEWANKIRNGK